MLRESKGAVLKFWNMSNGSQKSIMREADNIKGASHFAASFLVDDEVILSSQTRRKDFNSWPRELRVSPFYLTKSMNRILLCNVSCLHARVPFTVHQWVPLTFRLQTVHLFASLRQFEQARCYQILS